MVVKGRPDGKNAIEVRITGRYKLLMTGELSVEDLDAEELARCQLKDKNGNFTGPPPKMLPKELVQRMRREFFARGDKLFEDSYVDAVQEMVKIMKSPMVDDAIRLKAAQYIVERVRGKTPDVVVVEGDQKPWQILLTKITTADAPAGEIVDVEVVEEDSPAITATKRRSRKT